MFVMKMSTVLVAAGSALAGAFGLAHAEPLKTMDDVGSALESCWTPPSGITGASVTLSFSFKRDGSLIGPPKTTAINVQGSEQDRKTFVDAATKAVESCVPLELASTLANGIAGTVYTMEFTSADR
ncbi:hypothetical protein [Mesorhizobium zhangyense]|jgi:hypothetical protein